MALKLYTYPENPRSYKALITARYNGVEIELPPFTFGVTNKTEEFLRLFPLGKVPALETPEGGIFESNAIARYVARLGNQSAYGHSLYETGCIDQWVDFASNELEPAVFTWIGPILGFLTFNKSAVDKAKETLFAALTVFDAVLKNRTFLVGNHVTLADIAVFCTLMMVYRLVLDRSLRARFPHVSRWFATVLNQPHVSAVVGPFTFCEEAAQPAAPTKGGAGAADADAGKKKGKKGDADAGEGKKGKKQQQQSKKQEEPVETAPAVTTTPAAPAAAEEEDEIPAEDPKPKSSLDLLPKSSFNLEEWKRVYSNAKNTRADALPWLWEHLDREGFSFWFCKYKYNDELTVLFKTVNAVGGFHNRAENCRKYAFSSMLILGDSSSQVISGVWLFRGTGFPDVMERCDDCELYEWRKADVDNASDKALIEDYLCWDRPIDGRPVLDGKNFK